MIRIPAGMFNSLKAEAKRSSAACKRGNRLVRRICRTRSVFCTRLTFLSEQTCTISLAVAFIVSIAAFGAILWHGSATAQLPGPFGQGAPPFDREEMLRRFDTNGDGELSDEERRAMREEMQRTGERPGGPMFDREEMLTAVKETLKDSAPVDQQSV